MDIFPKKYINGYTFLDNLKAKIKSNEFLAALDLGGLVARFQKRGSVVRLPDKDYKFSVDYLGLRSDLRLEVNGADYYAKQFDLPQGVHKSMVPFMLKDHFNEVGAFALYSKLPCEIRIKILRPNLVPQRFTVEEVIDEQGKRRMIVHGPPLPALLRVSKGVRIDVMEGRFYKKALVFGDGPGYYFNQELDSIMITSAIARDKNRPTPLLPCMTLMSSKPDDPCRQVRQLSVEFLSLKGDLEWACKAMTELEHLEAIHIVGILPDPGYYGPPVTVFITLEEHDENGQRSVYPRFRCWDGYMAPGLAAFNAIENLPTTNQHITIHNLMHDMEEVLKFPKEHPWPADWLICVTFFAAPPEPEEEY